MRLMGLVAIYQRPNTSARSSISFRAAAVHTRSTPNLIGGLHDRRVDHGLGSDVPPPSWGSLTSRWPTALYVVIMIGKRAVLAWRLRNTLGAEFMSSDRGSARALRPTRDLQY